MSSALDFLSPSLARDEGGFHPVARSAAERLFRAADATFEERDGWLVPTRVPGEAEHLARVGISDLSHLGALDVRPAPPADLEGDGVTTYRLSPKRALVVYPQSARTAVGEQVAGDALVVDMTAAFTVLGLTGPDARALVSRLTHLHRFPAGGEVAHVTAHVLPAGAGYRVVVAQELGYYLAEVALDCATALGGGLVGVDALPREEAP
jgi:glycine cleavage system aminomethyltransferase T